MTEEEAEWEWQRQLAHQEEHHEEDDWYCTCSCLLYIKTASHAVHNTLHMQRHMHTR